jgi:hypothetical protein
LTDRSAVRWEAIFNFAVLQVRESSNLALLKIATPGDDAFRSVRIAPLYDALSTRTNISWVETRPYGSLA